MPTVLESLPMSYFQVLLWNNIVYVFAKAGRTSWLVVFCERSERLGVWQRCCRTGPIFAASGGVQGVNGECFAG